MEQSPVGGSRLVFPAVASVALPLGVAKYEESAGSALDLLMQSLDAIPTQNNPQQGK